MTTTTTAVQPQPTTYNRTIKKVAILGSGVMGSRIACLFANVGVQVILLDIVPREPNAAEQAKGLTLESKAVRNRIVNDSLQFALKSKPDPIFKADYANRIVTGNLTDDLHLISTADWIIEVVIENLDIKKQLYEKVEAHRKQGSLITSNTSGIPIRYLAEGRSDDFKAHFCGTHFFNPPRYLALLEIIPTQHTLPQVTNFLMHYGDVFLGKDTILCKDTPAFIANRIGVFAIMTVTHLIEKYDLTIEEADLLVGPSTGKSSSGAFRTCDIVGMDTMNKVCPDLYQNCPNDEARETFKMPSYIQKMIENGWYGEKTGQGFYKKVKTEAGKTEIYVLNTKTMEYYLAPKATFPCIEAGKQIDQLIPRLKTIHAGNDKGAQFLNDLLYKTSAYITNRVPEITEHIYSIDAALKSGFGWEIGPFEQWDALGVEKVIKGMEQADCKPATWVYEMVANGFKTFYTVQNGKRKAYSPLTKQYENIEGTEEFIILDNTRKTSLVWKNAGASLHDIGDGVLCLEFHSKMNTLGGEVLNGINYAISLAEKENWKGLVIGNDAPNFSAGANLGMIFMYASMGKFMHLDFAIRAFQNTVMRLRYSGIPVVNAPHGLTLGGGCELCLHADKNIVSTETYTGLVELGVGVVPAGGGTKELTLRAADSFYEGDPEIPILSKYLMNIASAKVSESAAQAFDMGMYRKGTDELCINPKRLIAEAKKAVLQLHEDGYTQPIQRTNIKVLGRTALGSIYSAIHGMQLAGYATAHDALIAQKVAYIMCGGDLSTPTYVSEQYLLDLEREAFLQLASTKKTLERMQAVLKGKKPPRN